MSSNAHRKTQLVAVQPIHTGMPGEAQASGDDEERGGRRSPTHHGGHLHRVHSVATAKFKAHKVHVEARKLSLQRHALERKSLEERDRRSQMRATVGYFGFVLLFTAVALSTRNQLYEFQMGQSLKEVLVFEQFLDENSVPMGFLDIAEHEDIFNWLEIVVAKGVYPTEYYNGNPLSNAGKVMILGNHYLVGMPRLRQVRVQKGSCQKVGRFAQNIGSSCLADYRPGITQETAPYSNVVNATRSASAFRFRTAGELGGGLSAGRLLTYDASGYSVTLPRGDRQAFLDLVGELKANRWVDSQTRAVFLTLVVYNPHVNLYANLELFVETPASGSVVASYEFSILNLHRYERTLDAGIWVMEILLGLGTLAYIVDEVQELWVGGRFYFTRMWNYFDMVNILLLICFFANRTALAAAVAAWNPDESGFVDMSGFKAAVGFESAVMAVNGFLLWFKCLKYLQVFSRSFSQLDRTLGRSLGDLLSFVLLFVFILVGFLIATMLSFGSNVRGYNNFGDALFSLLLGLLGNLEFSELQYSARISAPIFFITYLFLAIFVLLNMFLAIVNDSYSRVRDEDMRAPADEGLFPDLRKRVASFFQKQSEEAHELQEGLATADVNNDRVLDRAELDTVVAAHSQATRDLLQADTGEELLRRYDQNNDNVLDEEEQQKLVDDLQTEQLEKITRMLAEQQRQIDQLVNLVAGLERS